MWHDGWHSFLWVWVPVSGSLCLFWRTTYTKGLRARFPKRTREGKAPKRIEQGSRQKSWKLTIEKSDCQDLWTQRMGWPTRGDESAFLVTLWEFSSNIRYFSEIQNARKVSQTSYFLRLELIQVRVRSFFFHPHGCVRWFVCP